MDAEQANHVLQWLQQLEQTATEQVVARRQADQALAEAQGRIAQLTQTVQQGGRATGVVDTRVLGKPDNWDGIEKALPKWSFVAKAYAGDIDQKLADDMTIAELSTTSLDNEVVTPEAQARSVQLYFILIMLCTGRALDRIANAPHGGGMEPWRLLFQVNSPKNTARLVVMMLEVLSFPLDTNDVVNSVETMERKIKEFERHASVDIPEFLKVGIVIRQTEEGPTRTHFVMHAHRLTTFRDIKAEVKAQSAVMAKTGDAMDVDSFAKGSPKGASKGSGKGKNSEACWCCGKNGHRASECFKRQKGAGKGKSKGKKGDGKGAGKSKKVFEGKSFKCGKSGHVSRDCRSKETNELDMNKEEPLSEDVSFVMASVELNALEIGSVRMKDENRSLRIGIDSCVAVTVFPKKVAEDYPMLQTPGKAKSYRPASGQLLPDLGARKVQVKPRDGSLRCVNPRVVGTHRALMAVLEM